MAPGSSCLLLVEMTHGLRAVMDTKLLIEVCDMTLQRPFRDDQLLCHFLIGESHGKQLQGNPQSALLVE